MPPSLFSAPIFSASFFSVAADLAQSAATYLPDWLLGLSLILLAILLALTLHGLLLRLVQRLARRFAAGNAFLPSLIERTRGITRAALAVFFVSSTLAAGLFDPGVQAGLAQTLLVLFTLLLGWAAIVAVDIGAELYLRRFRLDVADNLLARKHVTQIRVLKRTANVLIALIAVSIALLTFDSVKQYGLSLLASAGMAGLVLGFAARPVLANMIAGIQIAITQPIRIDDAVVVENEWGWVEEITATYVVIKLWDWRRLILPLSYFIEKPFQNWTRQTASIIGTVLLYADYTLPVERLRAKLEEIVRQTPLWDGDVVNLQVVEANERGIQIRALVSARNSPQAWDLRCFVREQLIAFLQAEYPQSLPKHRQEWHRQEWHRGAAKAGLEAEGPEALPENGANTGIGKGRLA